MRGLIGAAFAVLPAKQYEASVVLLAQPPPGATDPGSDVGAIQIEIPQIVVEATNAGVADQARVLVPARYRSEPVKLSATGDPSSNSVTIVATSSDPAAAQAYANALAAKVLQLTNREATTTLVLSELGPAQLPTTPTNPRKTIVVASIAFGLIAAVFAALEAASLRRRFVTADEIRERVGLTVLGEVPMLVHAGGGPAEIFESTEDQRALEAFQQLRSSLHLLFQDTSPTIAVTSWDAREGKSSVASHVAWALAMPGRSVVAVDCDLRKPSLHEIFGVALSPGVSDYFAADGPDELMAPTGNRYLDLIPAGVPGRHPDGHRDGRRAPAPGRAPRVGPDDHRRLPAPVGGGGDQDPGGQGRRRGPRGRLPEVRPRAPRAEPGAAAGLGGQRRGHRPEPGAAPEGRRELRLLRVDLRARGKDVAPLARTFRLGTC